MLKKLKVMLIAAMIVLGTLTLNTFAADRITNCEIGQADPTYKASTYILKSRENDGTFIKELFTDPKTGESTRCKIRYIWELDEWARLQKAGTNLVKKVNSSTKNNQKIRKITLTNGQVIEVPETALQIGAMDVPALIAHYFLIITQHPERIGEIPAQYYTRQLETGNNRPTELQTKIEQKQAENDAINKENAEREAYAKAYKEAMGNVTELNSQGGPQYREARNLVDNWIYTTRDKVRAMKDQYVKDYFAWAYENDKMGDTEAENEACKKQYEQNKEAYINANGHWAGPYEDKTNLLYGMYLDDDTYIKTVDEIADSYIKVADKVYELGIEGKFFAIMSKDVKEIRNYLKGAPYGQQRLEEVSNHVKPLMDDLDKRYKERRAEADAAGEEASKKVAELLEKYPDGKIPLNEVTSNTSTTQSTNTTTTAQSTNTTTTQPKEGDTKVENGHNYIYQQGPGGLHWVDLDADEDSEE